MNELIPDCQANIPISVLSAWYDQQLDQRQVPSLESHVRGCQACQQHLSMYQSVTQSLQSDSPPELQDRIWRGIQLYWLQKTSSRHARFPLAALSMLVVVLVLFASVFVLLSQRGHSPPMTVVTNTPGVTPPLPRTTDNASGPPWVSLVTIGSQRVFYSYAFPVGDPQTIYGCAQDDPFTSGFVQVLRSADRGTTWNVSAKLAGSTLCTLSINPYHPTQMTIMTAPCPNVACDPAQPGDGNYNEFLYRSDDGGVTWTKILLSGIAFRAYNAVWLDDALFFTGEDLSDQTHKYNFFQVVGTTVRQITTDGQINGVSLASNISAMFSTKASLFVGYGQPTEVGYLPHHWRSDNQGKTWTSVDDLHLIGVTPDGATLIADGLRLSTDNGKTWQQRSLTFPSNLYSLRSRDFLTITPDDTLFIRVADSQGNQTLFRQLSWETMCTPVQTYIHTTGNPKAALPNNFDILRVTWDASGQPAVIYEGSLTGAGATLYRLDLK